MQILTKWTLKKTRVCLIFSSSQKKNGIKNYESRAWDLLELSFSSMGSFVGIWPPMIF